MNTRISVVMPMYNAGRHLAAAIQSIRNQSYQNWELFCLDDGSTDDTRRIVEHQQQHDPRIHYVDLPHRGIVATLNAGFALATGSFIARMDADDLSLPNRFELQVTFLNSNPEVAIVGGAYQLIDASDAVWKTCQPPTDPVKIRRELSVRNCLCHPAMMFRRELIESIAGPYRAAFPLAEDYDLWLRASESVLIGNLPDIVLHYRRDLSIARPERTARQTLGRLACQMSARARRSGQPDPAENWYGMNRSELLAGGWQTDDLNFEIRKALFHEARQAKQLGYAPVAASLLTAATHIAPCGTTLRRKLDLYFRTLQVRMA